MKGAKEIPFVLLLFVLSAVGQKNDISEAEYRKAELKAAQLLKASNYRLERKLEYFPVRGETPRLAESDIKEVLLPNKWRTVEFRDHDGKPTREERLWDGNALYVRREDGEWNRFSRGSTASGRSESGQVTTKYRYLGKVELTGMESDLYEAESLRIANKFSTHGFVVVRYNKRVRTWYSTDGRLLQKIEENSIEGREELSRETTVIEYDPKIRIEAPIK